MKSNRGVTLTSLVVYITGLVIMISIMGTFTGYFYNNLNETTMKQNAQEEYSKFLTYVTKDVNSDDLVFVQSSVDSIDCLILKFDSGEAHQYIYQNNNIYYLSLDTSGNIEKKITLCSNVSTVSNVFSYSSGTIDINCIIKNESFSNSLTVNL